ncbi:MAG: EAL domain-containing protein [Cellvibrionaceae bacterium]|nr:EAL domain-containing protein [Cellvibrionaceae bacterium]
MSDSWPWVMFLLYITIGYLLVAGGMSAAVAVVSRSAHNRFAYGALAVMGFSGAGYQVACAYYYQTAAETAAITALLWQTDCASLMLLATGFYFAAQRHRGRLPDNLVFLLVLAALMLVVANRTSAFSLHFADIPTLHKEPSSWQTDLSALRGKPGGGAFVWHGVMFFLLACSVWWNHQARRDIGAAVSFTQLLFILLLTASVAASFALDFGIWQGIYPAGFALTAFFAWITIGASAEAARNSRQLQVREREMEGEIRQRRKAEDKLERLSQVFTQAPTATHIIDLAGRALQVNDESVRLLRRDVSAPPKVNFLAVLEHLGVPRAQVLDSLAQGESAEFGPYFFAAGMPVDALYLVRDAWLKFKLYPIVNQERELQEVVVRLEDVSERQFVESAIKTISMAVSTETGHVFFNQLAIHLARLLNKKYVYIGLKKLIDKQLVIETLAVAVDGELVGNLNLALADSPSEKVLLQGAYAVPRQLQREFPYNPILRDIGAQSFVGAAMVDAERNAIGLIAVLDNKPMEHVKQMQEIVNIFVSRAATELHRLEAEQRIRKMAYEDALTGLPNRSALNEHVINLLQRTAAATEAGVAEARNSEAGAVDAVTPGAFIQLDLDHFKTINDALGHDIGDDVLRCIARRLRQNLGDNILVARLGGDEFAVVIDQLGPEPEIALERCTQQLVSLMEQPVQVGDHLLDLGCTLGVVLFPEFAATALDVFRNADIALNKAKSSGRGGFQLFTPEMRDSVSHRLAVENGLRAALVNQELHVFYQPQLDGAGNLMGAEALIRWQHPEQGWIPPLQFIPVAEESGLINSIGQWILEAALKHRKNWAEKRLPFTGHLSINVSPWQFARPDFVPCTIAAVEQLQMPPSHITLEVTESALLTDIDDTIAKLGQLRRFGVTIALDDFGTGYSSLAYLRDLPLDILKIDKTFVDALEINEHEPLVESMIAIGRNMGLQVVAEGVETAVQLERLKGLGCNVFQGYLFSRPLPEAEFQQWLRSNYSDLQSVPRQLHS